MAGLIDSIKNDVKKSGASKGKFVYFREGTKQRIRFLVDLDDGMAVTFHDSFKEGVNVPCQEQYGRECPYCEQESLRTRTQYVWPVYNYENNDVQLFMFPVNNCSPVPAIMAMYEAYGTITDRDYVISVSGKGADKTYSVVPMDKAKFRNAKAKPFSEKKILEIIDKAYPADGDDNDEDDTPKKKAPAAKKSTSKAKPEPEDDDDYDEEVEDDTEMDYSEMSAKELYQECKAREIEAEPRKPQKYYIKLLEEYDKAQDDWGDEDADEDDWGDDEE